MKSSYVTSDNLHGFSWDSQLLINQLSEVRYLQGRLAGKMESIEKNLRKEAIINTLTLEALKSNEIEGDLLNENDVRKRITDYFKHGKRNILQANENELGMVQILMDATQNYTSPLTYDRLNQWNSIVFKNSDYENTNKVSESEMTQFLAWFNSEDRTDPVIKAGVAHIWYLSVVRFKKGNGRIARVLTDIWLSRADNTPQRFYSMSAQIRKERIGYYEILVKQLNDEKDITPWLSWFLNCLLNSLKSTSSILSRILFKADFWNKYSKTNFNSRQLKMLDLLFDEFQGKLTTSKWARLTRCSSDSALRDIQDLINKGILVKENEGGRSTNYELKF